MESTAQIGDIVERDSPDQKSVAFTGFSTSTSGFPSHKRRWKSSAFKQRQAESVQQDATSTAPSPNELAQHAQISDVSRKANFDEAERIRIDDENRQRLAGMTAQEIAQAQDDLMNGLNPALIQRLLQRAQIDEPSPEPSPFDVREQEHDDRMRTASEPQIKASHVEEDAQAHDTPDRKLQSPRIVEQTRSSSRKIADDYDEDEAPSQIPVDLFPITDLSKSTHFPTPLSLPDLDPVDPNFLSTLHEKYFPSLPADPSKLAWMAPVPTTDSPADKDSPYYPHPEIAISALRFDFRGRFLSPRVSRSVPSTKGLHHHGEAPEAAGYTVAELARLARSAVPAQRCMAYQTLGRILYRLGRGEWGKTEDDPIAMGTWAAVKKGRVLESLMEAAAGQGGHRGSRAYATEALWLFEKGGWKEKWKGR